MVMQVHAQPVLLECLCTFGGCLHHNANRDDGGRMHGCYDVNNLQHSILSVVLSLLFSFIIIYLFIYLLKNFFFLGGRVSLF